MKLFVNGHEETVAGSAELRQALLPFALETNREIWLAPGNGPSLCALLNGDGGFLMYLRSEGDAGFTSRNPDIQGDAKTLLKYRLTNGQIDEYPASWSLGEDIVMAALEYFVEHQARPPFITWHDDSGSKAGNV